MITSSSAGNGMWLSLALLAKLAASADYRPLTIEHMPRQDSPTAVNEPPLTVRLVHDNRVIARVSDEQFAITLVAVLEAVPACLQEFAEIFVDLLRKHSTDPATGRCEECGQPGPCGTRRFLQEKVGAPALLTNAPPARSPWP